MRIADAGPSGVPAPYRSQALAAIARVVHAGLYFGKFVAPFDA